PEPQTVPGDNNYAVLAGTSMSAPHVAGIASLVWQSNPLLTSAQMRERLRRTATPVPPSPNTTWGYGKPNALAAVSASVASITAPATATPGTPVMLTSEKSSGAFGNPLSFLWTFPSRPIGSGASLSSPASAEATFVPDIPGNYKVSLTVSQASPPGTPSGIAEAVVRVNNVPIAAISGPASDNVGLPVTFTGSGSSSQDVGQALTYRWVLVSRPTDSSAALPTNNIPNVTFTPDVGGIYEVGLRVDDGLDNSALVTKTFTATGVATPQTGGGGGDGGCSVGIGIRAEGGPSSLPGLLLLLLPLGVLSARKNGYRFLRHRRPAATKCR
ncbi:MAG TPA: S8 family serine peptidase, partial [Candidatus Deferrimicrobiaceae bacterium]|nr:S8 family serine peptidase [Candidatus Deferrimicrobiaceae bacterium]